MEKRDTVRWEAQPSRPSEDDDLQVIVFALGSQRYGLPVDQVREVVLLPALLQLAGAAEGLCGLLNRRGVYIPVIDGRWLVNLPHLASLESQIVLAGPPQSEIGLLVDRVIAVEHLASDLATRLNQQVAGKYFASLLVAQDGPVLLLDLPALLGMASVVNRQEPS